MGFFVQGGLMGQELEPRAFARAPVRMHILLMGYSRSVGNIFLDPSLPIEDARARMHILTVGYAGVAGVFNRMSMFSVVLPVGTGNWRGIYEGQPASTSRRGMGDATIGMVINLLGAPALSGRGFLEHREKFQLGAGLRISVPLGQYDETKLINLGTNRWMARPALGGSVKFGRWILETQLSCWFFGKNGRFLIDNTLTQRPLCMLQLHAVYQFRPGLWAAVSVGSSMGGETVVNKIEKANAQNNRRFGATLALPLGARHGLNLTFTSGISTRFGTDFNTFGAFYQYRWGGR
jgi:hypothetical protein